MTNHRELTPICATVSHVDVQDRDSKAQKILVKHAFILWSCQLGDLFEARATPSIIASALILYDGVRRARALIEMNIEIIDWKLRIWPVVWITTVKTC